MKHFDSTKPEYNHLLKYAIFFIDFLYKCDMDFTYEVIIYTN